MGKYNFINLHKVILRNFSLYKKKGKLFEVNESINQGVYCLAGANGLGKTTFLNAINYGLTGIVLEPNKEVYIPNEIVKWNKGYTERYFQGRIKSADNLKAEVELIISINKVFIRIIRGFANREEVRLLEIYKTENNKKILLFNTNKLSPKELQNKYEEIITKETGIGKFDYFMFFQLYVLTFDENRRLLFWDDRASTSALSIAFNENTLDTDKVLEIKKQMEEYESYGRNARWEATQTKKEIDKLLASNSQKKKSGFKILQKEFYDIHKEIEKNERTYNEINIEYDTLLKRQNIINSEVLHLKVAYKKLFSQYSEPRSKLLQNPIVKLAKKENQCYLCNAQGHNVIEVIEKKLYSSTTCPSCDTPINNENKEVQANLLKKIKDIDNELSKKSKKLDSLILDAETKKVEFDKSEVQLGNSKKKLQKFEKENSSIVFEKTGNKPIDSLIDQYTKLYEKSDKKAKDFYNKRDKLKPEYDQLISKLDEGFKEAKEVFIPLFKKIAYNFIGINLNIYPQRKGKDFVLFFEMKDTARTASHHVSESQRFFLDIALRMALAVHLSNKNNSALMLIDTPEGSLDIAYESRVGRMFSEFVSEFNQNILMTANINSSQLLVSLAEGCGSNKMQFRRMLDWTDMNDIQKEGEHLFNIVYKNIESTLKKFK